MSTTTIKSKSRRSLSGRIIWGIICCLLLVLARLSYYSATWYADTYGQLGFDSILYTLFSNLDGVQNGLVLSWAAFCIIPSVLPAVTLCLLLFPPIRKKAVLHIRDKVHFRIFPLPNIVSIAICLLVCGGLFNQAANAVQLPQYLQALRQQSTIFQDEYRNPDDVTITFPEEKRNLIYIFLESMEGSYLSVDLGGGMQENLIPELYQLGNDYINFSHNESVGGALSSAGATWTAGAMVAHSSGVPLKTPLTVDGNAFGQDGNFLSGLTTLTDILRDNGYYQALMFGSDANFGGRQQYYTDHGIDRIYDYFTAIEDGIIAEDYYVWWGMEDHLLYGYAKQELLKIAENDQPFSFTMLTADTHHVGGYVCSLCENNCEETYETVMNCASRQLYQFLLWLQQQDFYENTTIIITGDHMSMDSGFFIRNEAENYTRTIYNCFVNAAATPANPKNRIFTTMDMFPSTLAAMGCTIEGDRLGLGVNLFSAEKTLAEQMGINELNDELNKYSAYYADRFYNEN